MHNFCEHLVVSKNFFVCISFLHAICKKNDGLKRILIKTEFNVLYSLKFLNLISLLVQILLPTHLMCFTHFG